MRLCHLLWLLILWLNMDKSLQQNEIKCTVPMIQNGYVPGDIQEYKEHEVLHFECNPQYKRAEDRPSICTKLGIRAEWSPTPVCEQIKCRLPPTLEGTRYEPAFRNVFSPGDTLRVICGEKYWISNHQTKSALATCKDDGQWTVRPVCQEVMCSIRRDLLGVYWHDTWRQQIKLDETVSYRCRSGYKRTDGVTRATCTRDGWRPNSLCEEMTCDKQDIPNADIVTDKQKYKYNEQVEYVCKVGYQGRPSLTCTESGWTGRSQCTEITCNRQDYPNADIDGNVQSIYRYKDQVEYTCKKGGQFTLTCGETGWIGSPECTTIANHCSPPPKVENAVAVTSYKKEFLSDSEVTYQCRDNYTMEGEDTIRCKDGKWEEKTITCTQLVSCGAPPLLADGDLKYTMKSQYSHNESVEYMCQGYYTIEGQPYRICINGKWTGHIRCLKPCVVNEDDIRQHNIALKSSDNKYLAHDEIIEFRCARGIPVGAVAMRQRCNGGVILLPTCQ